MKKSLALLLLAVLLPSVLLGWLALRSTAEQQIVLERRTAELYQKETENVAVNARVLVDGQRQAFTELVAKLLAAHDPQQLAGNFTAILEKSWRQPAVGFALNRDGRMLCPTARDAGDRSECQQFLWDNGAFIGNKTIATVYNVPANDLQNRAQQTPYGKQILSQNQATPVMGKEGTPRMAKVAPQQASKTATPWMDKEISAKNERQQVQAQQDLPSVPESGLLVMKDAPLPDDAAKESPSQSPLGNSQRNVMPQQANPDNNSQPLMSQLNWATADFRELTAGSDEGVINRFVQDRLNMIFWVRPAQAHGWVFGCLIQASDLKDLWATALPAADAALSHASYSSRWEQPEYILALLDDKAHPVATQPVGTKVADWKHPFVASEIGEALPHWEVTLYLTHPEQLEQSAKRIRGSLILLIASALTAIAVGGGLVIADTRRQLLLAQKKTDFVSNVSHELKTPLTSIRMFAELMHEGRTEPARQSQYLRIIMVEAERLTRLINNVLDFARLERRQRRLDKRPLDLHAVVARVWEGQELHLRESGFVTKWDEAPPPYPVIGDADALAQVLVNLLSNAEKYSSETKEVVLQTYRDDGHVCVSVLDRGLGVPAGEECKIFQAFYRAHDSLASGIQGAGLGLTLAQRLIQDHDGKITCQPRADGGSNFTIHLPLAAN